MGGQKIQAQNNQQDDKIILAANFVIQKSLARLNVFDAEIKILDEHLRQLIDRAKINNIKKSNI
jgi:hypothetical protein